MPDHNPLLDQTRRHFFKDCAIGLGGIALSEMLNGSNANASSIGGLHHKPKAKNVIFLFMAGGPSQLDLFDEKPELTRWHTKPIPQEFIKGKRFAFMDSFSKETPKLLATPRKFKKYGQSGASISELFPSLGTVADDITIVRSMATNVFNHAPAKVFMNSGSAQFGRPSMGSWVTYGIGSESQNLPGFVVLQSGPRGPRGGSACWASGFLPTSFQGVPLRGSGEPILNLLTPKGITDKDQRHVIDAVRDLNSVRLLDSGDPEIASRIASYEMAHRMQSSAPELIDLSKEDQRTLDLYGPNVSKPSFARNCLLARRLVERGTRFVQLYHTDWDHHGGGDANLETGIEKVCADVDRPCAALITDLKQRGLLDDTLVIWGGEFGRTPMSELRETTGRNHHIDAFSMWLAGGGVKPGAHFGKTDDFGFSPVEDRVHVHDLHATILHLLGIDHLKLTFKFQGRNFRLTDVHGEVVQKLLA